MYSIAPSPIHYSSLQHNNVSYDAAAWLIQQQQRATFTTTDQTTTSTVTTTNNNNTKLKHKEVVLYKTESCRNWTELGHCRY